MIVMYFDDCFYLRNCSSLILCQYKKNILMTDFTVKMIVMYFDDCFYLKNFSSLILCQYRKKIIDD